MAGGTKGRDLKVSFLTDLNQFDASAAADELERVGDASEVAGKGLDKLERDAKETAAKVDASFDKIAKSSKANMGRVDDEAHKAGQGLDEFKGEANSTGREAAASFQGVEDGLSAVQELAANAFQGFGPAGAAAGLLAAGGIGLVSSGLQKAADAANATKDRVIGLAQAIQEAGGNLAAVDVVGLMREWNAEIADNKSWWELWQRDNVTNLEKFSAQAKESGLDIEDYMRGISGLDSMAAKRSLDEINKRMEAHRKATEETADATDLLGQTQGAFAAKTQDSVFTVDAETRALKEAKDALLERQGVSERAVELAALQEEAVGREVKANEAAKEALDGHREALESFVNPAGAYSDLLAAKEAAEQASAQATADATEDEKDSWEDYVKAVDVSVGEYLKALERQVEAQANWAGNLQTLARRGVSEGVLAELEKMGPQGAPLVAKLTKASDAELTKLVTLFGQKGAAGGQAVASSLAAQSGAVGAAGRKVHDAAAVALARAITVPVNLADVTVEARKAWLDADRYFRNNPVTIRTKAGKRPVRDVP